MLSSSFRKEKQIRSANNLLQYCNNSVKDIFSALGFSLARTHEEIWSNTYVIYFILYIRSPLDNIGKLHGLVLVETIINILSFKENLYGTIFVAEFQRINMKAQSDREVNKN